MTALAKLKNNKTPDIINIDPVIATEILHRNNHNRPISDLTVKRYAQMMRQGKWQFNGEPIIIGEDGSLIDGQHRLKAIIDSKSTQEMIVVKGVSKTAYQTIDIGKKRTGADALATHNKDYRKNSAVIAAAVHNVKEFDEDGKWRDERGKRCSHDELISFVEGNKGLLRSVEFTASLNGAKKLIPFSALAALHFLFSRRDVNMCESFFHKLNTGENLTKNDPALLLRNRLIEMRHMGGVFRTREVVPYILKAWEILREGREVTKLRVDNEYIPRII